MHDLPAGWTRTEVALHLLMHDFFVIIIYILDSNDYYNEYGVLIIQK